MFRNIKFLKTESTSRISHFLKKKPLITSIKMGVSAKIAYDFYHLYYFENRFALQSISASDFHPASDVIPPDPEEILNVKDESALRKLVYLILISTYTSGIFMLLFRHPSFFIPLLLADIILNKGKTFTSPTDHFHQYLLESADTTTNRIFQQSDFISLINNQDLHTTLNEMGVCYGLTVLWYLYETCGKDLIYELNEISNRIAEKTPLNRRQIKLLEDISTIQMHQSPTHTMVMKDDKANTFNLLAKKIGFGNEEILYHSTMNYHHHMVNLTINEAINHPNSLIAIAPVGNINHIIGMIAAYDKKGNKWKFKYFDSNYKEVLSDNVKDIRISMKELISKSYTNQCNGIRVSTFSLKEKGHSLFWKNASSLGKSPFMKNTEIHKEKIRRQR